MPITLTDDQGNELDLDKADGGTLRKKLEEALAENRRLSEAIVTAKAEKAISEHGKGLVKTEDLKGVAPDEVEAKVKEIAERRLQERRDVIRDVLQARDGLEGDELEAAVDEFLGGGSGDQGGEVDAEPDLNDLSSLGGERPALRPKLPPMDDPFGNLESYFAEQESRSRRRR